MSILIRRSRSRSGGRTKIERTSFVVRGDDPAESIAIDNEGITIETGKGNDKVKGNLTAIANFDATAIGIKGGTINTEEGRDSITGEAQATAGDETSDPNSIVGATATGIDDVTINTGDDRDILIGDATAFCGNPEAFCEKAEAIGIKDSFIELGDGDDLVLARARGNGINTAIQNTTINGQGGNDMFNIQNFSGTNNIIGGAGVDTLELEGSSSDYTFTAGLGSLEVTINNLTDPSELINVSEVEQFGFADRSFNFGMLPFV